MIITILPQKYIPGCGKGMIEFDLPSLVTKINSIIEWDKCTWPLVKDEEGNFSQDTKFLGDDPELKPGDCFLLDGQVIACDSKDKIILILSETGYGSLQRLYDEVVKPEFDLYFNYGETEKVEFESVEPSTIPEDYLSFNVPYPLMKIFKSKYVQGRDYPEKDLCIKTTMESPNYIFPVTIYIRDWKVMYSDMELEEDNIEDAVKELFAWFYNKYPRVTVEEKKEEKSE